MFSRGLRACFPSRRCAQSLMNFSVTPAEEGASGFVTAVACQMIYSA